MKKTPPPESILAGLFACDCETPISSGSCYGCSHGLHISECLQDCFKRLLSSLFLPHPGHFSAFMESITT